MKEEVQDLKLEVQRLATNVNWILVIMKMSIPIILSTIGGLVYFLYDIAQKL